MKFARCASIWMRPMVSYHSMRAIIFLNVLGMFERLR